MGMTTTPANPDGGSGTESYVRHAVRAECDGAAYKPSSTRAGRRRASEASGSYISSTTWR